MVENTEDKSTLNLCDLVRTFELKIIQGKPVFSGKNKYSQ